MRFLAVIAVAMLPLTARAQSPADSLLADRSGAASTEIWAGYSPRSPKWGVLGNRPGMSFGIAAVRLSHRIRATPHYALDYTVDFVPLAVSSPPLGDDFADMAQYRRDSSCLVSVFGCRFPSGSAFGWGVSPLGITAVYRRDRVLQPRFGITGGALMFDRATPTIMSTRFNFTASVEAGAQMLNRKGNGILLVYRFHHLSNAGTGYDNSALASHVISLGARLRTDTK